MRYIIDRFEEDYVVCEGPDKTMTDYKRSLFPSQIKVGDLVEICDNKVVFLEKETKKRREEISALMNELWE